ncbi:MAG: Uma2 family endonuclease [Cyclobacteriaceae bacterium]
MVFPIEIKTKSFGGMTDRQFERFCIENEPLNFERNSKGEIIVMPPTSTNIEFWNNDVSSELNLWNRKSKLGFTFGNNAGFKLSNGAIKSPDAAFVSKARISELAPHQKKGFYQVCPDFVIEILSDSDSLPQLKEKMKEWIDNGCILAWLINPQKKKTTIYRANEKTEEVSFHTILSGENLLPNFKINLKDIFDQEI